MFCKCNCCATRTCCKRFLCRNVCTYWCHCISLCCFNQISLCSLLSLSILFWRVTFWRTKYANATFSSNEASNDGSICCFVFRSPFCCMYIGWSFGIWEGTWLVRRESSYSFWYCWSCICWVWKYGSVEGIFTFCCSCCCDGIISMSRYHAEKNVFETLIPKWIFLRWFLSLTSPTKKLQY